jgi:hypothetical protein
MSELRHVSGLDALRDALKKIPSVVRTQVLRKAVLSGASVVRKEMVKTAPIYSGPQRKSKPQPGTLRRAILNKFAKDESNETQATYIVTARKGKKERTHKQGSRDAFYAAWVERGHKVVPRRQGKGKGGLFNQTLRARRAAAKTVVQGVEFMKKAYETMKDTALKAIMRRTRLELKKLFK